MRDVYGDNLDVLLEQDVDDHVELGRHNEIMEKEKLIPEIKSIKDSFHSGATQDDARRFICEILEKRERRTLGFLTDDIRRKVVLASFEEARERPKINSHKLLFDLIEQAVVKYFFTGGAHVLHDDKMIKFAEFQGFTQCFVRDLRKPSAFSVPVTSFVKQGAERTVANEAKVKQDMNKKLPSK